MIPLKQIVKLFVPPVILNMGQKICGLQQLAFEGNYSSWQEAVNVAEGYDAPTILERVREATLKVKRGEAVFERDSICFYHEEYRWSPLACLLRVAAENGGVLRVLDFGGALGSFYFQHRKHFQFLKEVRWSVVEQAHYVECGRTEFQDESLHFYESMSECLDDGNIDVIFCSGVLQYLEDPHAMLGKFSKRGIKYILLDRTPFIEADQDRLTVQTVPASIYSASYPAWFFSSALFKSELNKLGFNQIVEFDGEDDVGIGTFKGVMLAHT